MRIAKQDQNMSDEQNNKTNEAFDATEKELRGVSYVNEVRLCLV